MAQKKISRKELLKGPDEFVTFSSRAAEYAKTHQKQLTYGGIILLVIAAGYLIVNAWMGSINEEGQNAYNQAVQSLEDVRAESQPAPENIKEAEALFLKVIEDYGMSNAAPFALAQIAHLKTLEKKYTEAITYYKKYLDGVSGDADYESIDKLALAACYEEEKDIQTAIETLAPFETASSDTPFREFAMWRLARLYTLNNQSEKAKQILQNFVEDYKESPFHDLAKSKL